MLKRQAGKDLTVNMVRNLLLGSAAGLVAGVAAGGSPSGQGEAIEYVRISAGPQCRFRPM
jgi:hypothetical protein